MDQTTKVLLETHAALERSLATLDRVLAVNKERLAAAVAESRLADDFETALALLDRPRSRQ